MNNKTTFSFAGLFDHMSLWEVAHRWVGAHPNETDPKRPPLEITDILKAMMRAQVDSDLWVAEDNGVVFKDWTYIPSWKHYGPVGGQEWDGTDDHLRELYLEYMHQVVRPHDDFICDHWDMLTGQVPFNKQYLEKIHVLRANLADWTLEESLPFPDFWFSSDEKAEHLQEFNQKNLIRARFKEYDAQGKEPPDDLYDQVLAEYKGTPDEELATTLFKPGRIKEEDIDEFWQRLADKQKHRLLCRSVAAALWKENPELTIREISEHQAILKYCGGNYYSGKDTIRNWIKELDPRPEEKRRGRPSSK